MPARRIYALHIVFEHFFNIFLIACCYFFACSLYNFTDLLCELRRTMKQNNKTEKNMEGPFLDHFWFRYEIFIYIFVFLCVCMLRMHLHRK